MLGQGIEWKELDFKLSLTIVETLDLSKALLKIPPKVMLINNTHLHFKCSIQDIGTLEMDEALENLCVNGIEIKTSTS